MKKLIDFSKQIKKYVPLHKIVLVSIIVFWILIFDNMFVSAISTTFLFFILVVLLVYVVNKPEVDKREKLSKDPEWNEYQRLKKKFNDL